jgi:hypothetical protein
MAVKIRGIEGMRAGEVDFEIGRGARFVLPMLHLDHRPHVSQGFGHLLPQAGRKRGDQRIAIHAAFARGGLLGHSLGTDLCDPIGLQQFARRQGRDGSPCSSRCDPRPRRQRRTPPSRRKPEPPAFPSMKQSCVSPRDLIVRRSNQGFSSLRPSE